ncbi:MAG TPA: efflux RND transporter periplasmic adaptor subunit, partial [Caulobacteraceae bacterium]|nr:efflux RND transporter periplasmic adaptor subunit [Caulobacteraceae bacterium]
SYVRQGQVLVKLNDTVLASQLRQQDAQVASAKATLAQATANLKRARELREKGFLAQAALDGRIAEQRTAEAGVAAAQAARAETAARRSQTEIRAPVSGLIVARSVVKGQIVTAGQELFRLVRDGRLELSAQVPEQQIALVRPGMPATVTGEGVTTSGVVRIVTPEIDPQTRVGLARISLAAGSGLRPGMFARAAIQVGAQPALTVPQGAVIFRADKSGVYVVDRTSHVRFRPVRTGARVGDRVEALSGIVAGERIVVQGAGFLADGDLVRVGR